MNKKGRKNYIIVIMLLFCVILRIVYVNNHARIPILKRIAQGESVAYHGIQYRVLDAELWDYETFFLKNEMMENDIAGTEEKKNWKVLLVKIQIESKINESLEFDFPIIMEHTCNWTDILSLQYLNPSMTDGTFRSGDILLLPYEIYKENFTDDQWSKVEEGNMNYSIVLEVYPVRTELMISNVFIEPSGEK